MTAPTNDEPLMDGFTDCKGEYFLRRLSAFWLGRDPATFYRWWSAKAVLLFGVRFLIYQVSTNLPDRAC